MRAIEGEHDYRKRHCGEYCGIDRRFCALSGVSLEKSFWWGEKAIDIDGKANAVSGVDRGRLLKEVLEYTRKPCWCDGSGFEYDLMPSNLVGSSGSMEGLYSLERYGIETKRFRLSEWNTWLEKFQVDYRFGQVSDRNAETVLFPDVEDPWMFTEYVFRGAGSGETIVEPDLYDERSLELCNADRRLEEKAVSPEVWGKYSEFPVVNGLEGRYREVRSFREVGGGRLYCAEANVESVKWGEHGNIPPGTLDMCAPRDWIEQAGERTTIERRVVAHLGAPFRAKTHGAVVWHDGECYVNPSTRLMAGTRGDGSPCLRYAVDSGQHAASRYASQCVPEEVRTSALSLQSGVERGQICLKTGQYSHGGCSFLKSADGVLWCGAVASGEGDLAGEFGKSCLSGGGTCPRYVGGPEWMVLADYVTEAADQREWNERVLGRYSGSGADGNRFAAMVGGFFGNLAKSLGNPFSFNDAEESISVWYETQFEVKRESAEPVQVKGGKEGFGRGAEVVRGSGRTALDTKEAKDAFRGDSVFFGDMDQAGFARWFESPMLCAKAGWCGEVCGPNMSAGWKAGERAGGSCGKCRYYRDPSKTGIGCPTTGLQKRAVEFQETMMACSARLTAVGTEWDGLLKEIAVETPSPRFEVSRYAQRLRNELSEGSPWWIEPDETNSSPASEGAPSREIYTIWSADPECAAELGGVFVPEDRTVTRYERRSDCEKGYVLPDGMLPSEDEEHFSPVEVQVRKVGRLLACRSLPEEGHALGRRVELSAFYWFEALDNEGVRKAVWCCRCDPAYVPFERNVHIVENAEKFIGGYHPQYKDYSKRGEEFMMEVESREYRDAQGDILGDGSVEKAIPRARNKRGYWTDEDGDFILDERSTGIGSPLSDDASREEATGDPPAISFVKTNTEINVETGEKRSPKTKNCAVLSNDPESLLHFYRSNGHTSAFLYYDEDDEPASLVRSEGRPTYYDDEGKPYWAPPLVKDDLALPTNRLAVHCPKCGYYLSFRYNGMDCPWCHSPLETIYGSDGYGVPFKKGGGEIAVPERERGANVDPRVAGELCGAEWPENASVLRKFFKLNAIGRAQVWAPPGTCVPLDGYYWKSPAIARNSVFRQIRYRLGTFRDNAFQFDKMNQGTEFTLGYPEGMGRFSPLPAWDPANPFDKDTGYSNVSWTPEEKLDRGKYADFNPGQPEEPVPGLQAADGISENLISPYNSFVASYYRTGLKAVTWQEIRTLRNALEPFLAYTSDDPKPPEYPRKRASYDDRLTADVPRHIAASTCCRVPMVIRASNEDSGSDCFVQFWSGDDEYGSVKEYYPAGPSWWYLNRYLGGRYTDMSGGRYHMDTQYGRRTVSKCAFFLHGVLPLDKEIAYAYLLIEPAGEPSKEPIGRGWDGQYHYEHYHAMTKRHFLDGRERHLHGQAGQGDLSPGMDDDAENDARGPVLMGEVVTLDSGGWAGWGDGNGYKDYRPLWNTAATFPWSGVSGVLDTGMWSLCGTTRREARSAGAGESLHATIYKTAPDSYGDRDYLTTEALRGNAESHLDIRAFGVVGLDSEGGLVALASRERLWSEKTLKDLEEELDRGMVEVEFKVTDGTEEGTVVRNFTQATENFVDAVYPAQSQAIAGYFDLGGFDSERRIDSLPEIVRRKLSSMTAQGGPVIVQAEGENTMTAGEYSGGGGLGERGIVARAMDITGLVRKHYNSRIARSFLVKGGKTLRAVMDERFPSPEWKGEGDWDLEDRRDWTACNRQERFPKNRDFYLLTDGRAVPKCSKDGGVPSPDSDGDEYELRERTLCVCLRLAESGRADGSAMLEIGGTIPNGSSFEIRDFDGNTLSSHTIDSPEGVVLSSPEDLARFAAEILPGFEISRGDLCVEARRSDLEAVELAGDWPLFGVEVGRVEAERSRAVSSSGGVPGYPADGLPSGRAWRTAEPLHSVRNAVFDLCRAPVLKSAKDWRYRRTTADCSSCRCVNPSCVVCQDGLTAGQYCERKNRSYVPGQTKCPSCGAELAGAEGASITPGDGIMTYEYLEPFAPSPFVCSIELDLPERLWTETQGVCAQSASVSCREKSAGVWRTLLTCRYDAVAGEYVYGYNGTSHRSGTRQTVFELDEKHRMRGRYLRLSVEPAEGTRSVESRSIVSFGETSLTIGGHGLGDLGSLDGRSVDIAFSDGSNGSFPLSGGTAAADGAELTLFLRGALPEGKTPTAARLSLPCFRSEVAKFNAYGFHWRESDLKILPAPECVCLEFLQSKAEYELPEYPTKILAVSIGQGDGGGIELTRLAAQYAFDPATGGYRLAGTEGLRYELAERRVSLPDGTEGIGYEILSGNYCFDYRRNRVVLPSVGVCGARTVKISDFESGIAGNVLGVSWLPTAVAVSYWTGNGAQIELDAQAEGSGPSYQLEKGTVTLLDKDDERFRADEMTEPLPDIGGEWRERKVSWSCDNPGPATLDDATLEMTGGTFRVPQLTALEINGHIDDDAYFKDKFGEHCCNISGRCRTKVVLTGPPDSVVAGQFRATAPATRVWNVDGAIQRERTGGLSDGVLVASCAPMKCRGRKTLAYRPPRLVVFARERRPDQPL